MIDGNGLLFLMFHGMPAGIHGKSGGTIHDSMGFLSSVLKQTRLFAASRVARLKGCGVFD